MVYFPKQLVERVNAYNNAKMRTNSIPIYDEEHVKQALDFIIQEKCYVPQIIFSDLSRTAPDIAYEYCINPHLRKCIQWINDNILYKLDSDSYVTLDVKVRIAVCMIDKLVEQELLHKSYSIEAGCNLYENVRAVKNILLNLDLPF